MSPTLAVLCAVVVSATPTRNAPLPAGKRTPLTSIAPRDAVGERDQPFTSITRSAHLTLEDAPTTRAGAFTASALTSLTGFGLLISLPVGPQSGQPMTDFAWRARLGASLLLMSVGPSMGDLLNHDTPSFLIGAGARTAIAGVSWLLIELSWTGSTLDPASLVGSVLFVGLGALVWCGWGVADLVRSAFAPDRWLKRTNEAIRSREPIAEVRQTGGLRFVR